MILLGLYQVLDFMSRLICYVLRMPHYPHTRFFWIFLNCHYFCELLCSTDLFDLSKCSTGWVFECMLNAQKMIRHLKALPALMHVNQTQCPIMSLSWACMIKCIYSKLRYRDKNDSWIKRVYTKYFSLSILASLKSLETNRFSFKWNEGYGTNSDV